MIFIYHTNKDVHSAKGGDAEGHISRGGPASTAGHAEHSGYTNNSVKSINFAVHAIHK